jgi:hypothetical protein
MVMQVLRQGEEEVLGEQQAHSVMGKNDDWTQVQESLEFTSAITSTPGLSFPFFILWDGLHSHLLPPKVLVFLQSLLHSPSMLALSIFSVFSEFLSNFLPEPGKMF